MLSGSGNKKQIWSICAVVLAAFAVNSAAQSSKYVVNFENTAYSAGTSYGQSVQSNDWSVRWAQGMDGSNAVISTDAKASGQRSLKIGYPPAEQNLKQAWWNLSGAKTYYLRYKVLFASDFEFNGADGSGQENGGKLPGLGSQPNAGVNPCGGCQPCGSGKGFTARIMWRTDGVGELYLYDVSKNTPCGLSFPFSGNKKFNPGAWQTVTQKVTLNDPGQSNGKVEVWLDGGKVVDTGSRKIVSAGEDINGVFFSTFFGGNNENWYPAKQETAFFDDFVVSQQASDVGL